MQRAISRAPFLSPVLSRRLALVMLVGLALVGLAACGGGSTGATGATGPAGPEGPAGPGVAGSGLVMNITNVAINADLRFVIDFTMEDEDGNPLTMADLDGSPRWGAAWIMTDAVNGKTYYQSYIVNPKAGKPYDYDGATDIPPTLASAPQAGTDSGGTHTELSAGVFQYVSGTQLPPAYDMTATHTVAGYATRGGRSVVDNPWHHWVPNGAPVTVTRDITATMDCNACHDEMAFHGGTRREVVLCQMCHTNQSIDPETGNTVDFEVMVHKIHNGAHLTDQPYYIVGYGQRPHDYSEVEWTQDVRNCATCHKSGADADNWLGNPIRTNCGSCHDDIDWVTGAGHAAGPQLTDNSCAACHQSVMGTEFDRSVPGAHVVPYNSSLNPNLTFVITDVTNMVPGGQPTVTFSIVDDAGPVDITTLDRVAMVFAGPTSDYTQLHSQDHLFTLQGFGSTGTLLDLGGGNYSYAPLRGDTSPYTIPPSADGTWSVGMESRTANISVNGGDIKFGANNPVVYIDLLNGNLGLGAPEPRRMVVPEAHCSASHKDVLMHGNWRTDLEYCVMCHAPWTTDQNRRPGLDPVSNPPESVSMAYMIHKVHRGHELLNGYTVWGYGPTEHDFSHVHYPGDLRNCSACHDGDTEQLPTPEGTQATVFNIDGIPLARPDAIRPTAGAACTACHDSADAITHILINSVIIDPLETYESCATCHGEGKTHSVNAVHGK